MSHAPIHPLPLSYRAALLQTVHKQLAAGKCGALIGVASSGKSRLVEFMGRPDVRQHYLGEDWTQVLFPWVDGNDLLECSEWGMYERVLMAILADLDKLPDRGGSDRPKAEAWYWKLVQPENRALARRLAAFAVADLNAVRRVVLLLDDFDDFFARADDLTLRGLRGLRDIFKKDNQYQVLFLLTLRRQPVLLREAAPEPMSLAFQSFVELFENFVLPVGCYDQDDALGMVRRLAEAFPLDRPAVTPQLAERLYAATWGHAGLIDAAFHSRTEARWSHPDLAQVLIGAPSVWNECESIWGSLDDDDRDALFAVAGGRDPGADATRWLEKCGLVRRDANQPRAVELLRLFLNEAAAGNPDIQLDADRRTLTVDGCAVELTEREFALAAGLGQARGQWRTYAELSRTLQAVQSSAPGASAPEAVRPVMQRVMSKLRRAGSGRSVIFHDPQRGYRMI